MPLKTAGAVHAGERDYFQQNLKPLLHANARKHGVKLAVACFRAPMRYFFRWSEVSHLDSSPSKRWHATRP
jgi:hypothetical protein